MPAPRLIGRTLLATAALAGVAAAPAAASPEPVSALRLAVHGEAVGSTAEPGAALRTALLTCDPAGGTHPKAEAACTDLAGVRGDLTALAESRPAKMCPLIYQPVTVTAQGTWRGKPVSFEQTFSNDCVATSSTGEVFAF
ncbi:SSI family serine proteinase inhibitor [Saccharopolyspora sp. CA-218241]|uniref:SSI family serine proteinase inhibitor n=1 Tax=Saccharopolyspora sp. CA-218241 TaxID=3240027 RepID=UPI003D964BC3